MYWLWLTTLLAPPWYEDRANLLFYLDAQGEKKAVRSAEDWRIRVGHVRANMELVMGALPAKSSELLAVEVKSKTALRHYTRHHLSYVAEKGDRVPAYLLVPHRHDKCPAMVCLPQTGGDKDEPAGLGVNAGLAYAHELAERGYVCIVVDYPLIHRREYATDPYQLGYVSATMKAIVNHRRAVDVLETLPVVDRERIGVIGHSLGGHNSLFLATFDERIKVIASSCGFNVFAKHAGGDVRAWSSRSYMPRIKTVYKDDPKKIPFDFTEVLAALAPRPVFINAPLHDLPDFEVSGVRDCVVAALPVYRQLFDAADRLVVHHPDAAHSFPLAERLACYHFLDKHLRPSEKSAGLDKGLLHHWKAKEDFKSAKLPLGKDDFTLSLWLHTDANLEEPGGLLEQYDAEKRRGFHLSLQTATGVTTNQPNVRQLQFGIDAAQTSPLIDCGRPGKATIAFGLAVHEGHLYAGTSEAGPDESGKVFRHLGGQQWLDCGLPSKCNAVTALATFQGRLYAGTGRYRFGGSALPESKNDVLGGRIYRYEGARRWTDCGQVPGVEAIGGLVVWRGKLYASSLYRPAGFFRYDGGSKWSDAGTPQGKRVEALAVFQEQLYASSYDGGHVYRHDGKAWRDLGRLGDNTQTYSFSSLEGRLHVGTWPSGRVYRLDQGDRWTDCGRLGEELEVMGMSVHNGQLYAGSLPLAEVYRFDGAPQWTKVGRLDLTPDVKYRRAWTMAEFQGRLFISALPSGKVFALEAGRSATWDHELTPGWHHVAAVKKGGTLSLYVDGRFAASSTAFDPAAFDLSTDKELRIGSGRLGPFRGKLRDVRIWQRAVTSGEIAKLAAGD